MWREQGKGQWRVEGMVLACEYRVYLWISEIHATIVKSVSDTLGRNMQLRDLMKIVLQGFGSAPPVPSCTGVDGGPVAVLLPSCGSPPPLLVYWPGPWHVLNNKPPHRIYSMYVPSCSVQQLDCLRIICEVQTPTNAENSGGKNANFTQT